MPSTRHNDAPLRSEFTEKRNYLRMQIEAEIEFQPQGQNKRAAGKSKNLSSAGILFETDHPVKQGDSIDIAVKTASAKYPPLRATASVLRIHPGSSGKIQVACTLSDVK
jgi:hypothetical protein